MNVKLINIFCEGKYEQRTFCERRRLKGCSYDLNGKLDGSRLNQVRSSGMMIGLTTLVPVKLEFKRIEL